MTHVLTLATTNAGKRREILAMAQTCGLAIEIVLPQTLTPVDETGLTFAENARIKALAAVESATTDLVLAEDSGFCVHALAGRDGLPDFPGVHSNRWMTEALRRELTGVAAPFAQTPLVQAHLSAGIRALMTAQADRSARYEAAMTLVSRREGVLLEARGSMPLVVIADGESPRGTGGFGYDPIVRPEGDPRTVAELTPEEKNAISHRAAAFSHVAAFLRAYLA